MMKFVVALVAVALTSSVASAQQQQLRGSSQQQNHRKLEDALIPSFNLGTIEFPPTRPGRHSSFHVSLFGGPNPDEVPDEQVTACTSTAEDTGAWSGLQIALMDQDMLNIGGSGQRSGGWKINFDLGTDANVGSIQIVFRYKLKFDVCFGDLDSGRLLVNIDGDAGNQQEVWATKGEQTEWQTFAGTFNNPTGQGPFRGAGTHTLAIGTLLDYGTSSSTDPSCTNLFQNHKFEAQIDRIVIVANGNVPNRRLLELPGSAEAEEPIHELVD